MATTNLQHVYGEKSYLGLPDIISFVDRPNYKAKVEDISDIWLQDFLRRCLVNEHYDKMETLERMRLLSRPFANSHPLNVAVLFFAHETSRFFPFCQIKVVSKLGNTDHVLGEAIFKDSPIHIQLENSLNHIKNSFIAEKTYKVPWQAERVRFCNYPFEAITEALTNAVFHKSYELREPITVTFFKDRMKIASTPGPDPSISDEDMKNGHLVSAHYRNRRIGDYLKQLKLAEGRNTGIPTIIKAMKDNNSPPPRFITDEGRTYFKTILPVNPVFIEDSPAEK